MLKKKYGGVLPKKPPLIGKVNYSNHIMFVFLANYICQCHHMGKSHLEREMLHASFK